MSTVSKESAEALNEEAPMAFGKCPTLEKLEDLAAVIGVHPVTLLVAVYTREGGVEAQDALLQEVKTQLK